jgi:hypothetical protein
VRAFVVAFVLALCTPVDASFYTAAAVYRRAGAGREPRNS